MSRRLPAERPSTQAGARRALEGDRGAAVHPYGWLRAPRFGVSATGVQPATRTGGRVHPGVLPPGPGRPRGDPPAQATLARCARRPRCQRGAADHPCGWLRAPRFEGLMAGVQPATPTGGREHPGGVPPGPGHPPGDPQAQAGPAGRVQNLAARAGTRLRSGLVHAARVRAHAVVRRTVGLAPYRVQVPACGAGRCTPPGFAHRAGAPTQHRGGPDTTPGNTAAPVCPSHWRVARQRWTETTEGQRATRSRIA